MKQLLTLGQIAVAVVGKPAELTLRVCCQQLHKFVGSCVAILTGTRRMPSYVEALVSSNAVADRALGSLRPATAGVDIACTYPVKAARVCAVCEGLLVVVLELGQQE